LRITAGIYQLSIPVNSSLRTINCYLLKDGTDAYLVDAAWPMEGTWEKLMELLQEADVEPSRLTGIILTHAHHDHVGYLERLQALTGAPVLLHPAEESAQTTALTRDPISQATWQSWYERHGVPSQTGTTMLSSRSPHNRIDWTNPRWLSPGEVVGIGSMNWEVVWTPGHSPGHICLLERNRRLLVTGDHVLPHESPNVSVRPNLALNPLGSYIASLHELQTLPVDQGLPGHGEVFGDFQQVVRSLIDHHGARFSDILAALGPVPMDAYQVACQIPWVRRLKGFGELEPFDQFLAFGETLAHLECLVGWGKARKTLLASDHPVWSRVE